MWLWRIFKAINLNKRIYYVIRFFVFLFSFLMFFFFIICLVYDIVLFYEWEFYYSVLRINIGFVFDKFSLVFLSTVSLISRIILGYSKYYISMEKNFFRFLLVLLLFVFSICLLITRSNLVGLILGWDGLGLSSYVLVIFYQNEFSCSAGILTVLSNRVGDVCILLSIGLMYSYGTWSFILIYGNIWFCLRCFIMLAGFTKRAQIPFSAWLPAAMAAPTPVSALVHSSTLVTAGVFVFVRFYYCIDKNVCLIILVRSIITMFIAGLGAMFEADFKKIIALSTLRQLGLIIIEVGLGFIDIAFCHLIVHALFKSVLFICAGVIIHTNRNLQDNRKLGGLVISSPVLRMIFGVRNISLCGFPFLSGFFSKDLILEGFFGVGVISFLLTFMVILGIGFTVYYRFRFIFLANRKWSGFFRVRCWLDRPFRVVYFSLLLYFFSIFGGFIILSFLFCDYVFILTVNQKYYVILISFLFLIFLVCVVNCRVFNFEVKFFYFLRKMWFIPYLSSIYVNFFLKKGGIGLKYLDKGWLEYYGGQGFRSLFLLYSSKIQFSQVSLVIFSYFLRSVFVLLIFMFFLYLSNYFL